MLMRNIAAFVVVVALGFLGATQSLFANESCIARFNCYDDVQRHKVIKSAHGKFLNASGKDYVSLETMYVGLHGWRVSDPRVRPPSQHRRKVEFYKAYLEVSESGELFDQNQKGAILDKIEQIRKQGRAVYVVAFVHGWHHNSFDNYDLKDAASLNKNTVKFHYFAARYAEQTRRLFELNGDRDVPVLFGIYIGWRGETTSGFWTNATIGARAAAADTIARADSSDSLKASLREIASKVRSSNEDSRMLLLGHSLGGRMLSIMFLNDITEKKIFQPLGKQVLIVALQPAISADCYRRVFTGDRVFGSRNTPPSFIALTSEGDEALFRYFTYAARVPLANPPFCDHYDRAHDNRFVTTIGNYKEFVTHDYSFRYAGDYLPKKPYPANLLNPDGKTLRFPLVDRERLWLYQDGRTIWFYPWFNLHGSDPDIAKNYNLNAAALYTLDVKRSAAWRYAGAVWNIRTNSHLIDTAEGSLHSPAGQIGARHNAFASTGVADILSRIVYASKHNWSPDEAAPSPYSAPALPPSVLPEPNRSDGIDVPRASGP